MPKMETAIRRGNIVYDLDSFQTGIPHVPPFVSNGIVGGCFDIHGFHSRPNTGIPEGRTHFGYLDHYHRAEHGRHIQFPLAIVGAVFADGTALNLVDCSTYRQELDLLTGTLTTEYDLYGRTSITAFADQAAPNLFVMKIEREVNRPGRELRLAIECETSTCQNNDTRWKVAPVDVRIVQEAGSVHVESRTNAVCTNWFVRCPTAHITTDGTQFLLDLPEGTHVLTFLVEREGCPGTLLLDGDFSKIHDTHRSIWHNFWKASWASFPDTRAQSVWTRTAYYVGCNFPLIHARPMCPTGLVSNIWGFYFPQDVYYLAENAPRLGHMERARWAARYWLDHLSDVKEYCRRHMGVEGAYYPWTPPYRDWGQYEKDGITGADTYELHNSAYVVAIVWHYYLISGDSSFLSTFLPLLEEVFRFYANISTKNQGGTYDIFHEHARGQDEMSSTAGKLKNLLCAQWSAQYCARAYLKASEITASGDQALVARARDIAGAGYNREGLLRAEGWYATYEGDDRPAGSQKHPVQLNPIAYLPMPDEVTGGSPTEAAWRTRYELTHQAKRPHTPGWTLGEFFLASVRMRAPQEAEKDLRAIQPCRSADPRWIQFYESSFQEGWHLNKSYYFPMCGLFLQGFTDTLAQDWRGYLDLFACLLPGWEDERIDFHGFHARGGVVASGTWNKGRFSVTLRPRGASSVRVRVSQPAEIAAEGQALGPDFFAGNEVVELTFKSRTPIKLTGRPPAE